MSTALRYTLYQIPGWIAAAAGCGLLVEWDLASSRTAALLFAAWVVKDAALYPFVRRAYEPPPAPHASLVGRRAVAREPLAPTGYVELYGQLWRAEVEGRHVGVGDAVRVRAVDGLTLRVVADPP